MKLLCFLISLAFVSVSVAELDAYVKNVIRTNKFIEFAGKLIPKVIENVVLGNTTMEEMAFMFAVPDYSDGTLECHKMQLWSQTQVRAAVRIAAKYNLGLPWIDEDQYKDVTLEYLANARRSITLEATKSIIRAVQHENNSKFTNFDQMCRLMGLFRSIKYPSSFIKTAVVDDKGICIQFDVNGCANAYSSFDGIVWEIKDENNLILPFADELI